MKGEERETVKRGNTCEQENHTGDNVNLSRCFRCYATDGTGDYFVPLEMTSPEQSLVKQRAAEATRIEEGAIVLLQKRGYISDTRQWKSFSGWRIALIYRSQLAIWIASQPISILTNRKELLQKIDRKCQHFLITRSFSIFNNKYECYNIYFTDFSNFYIYFSYTFFFFF